MAKTNFQYEKRQKELEKKKKAEEKARRKLEAKNNPKPADGAEGDEPEADDVDTAADGDAPVQPQ
ncbi:hypothetical protein GCN74_10560 [Janthinobacterium sp. FT14W]|uniref:hypothetical protein n=1 Tax=Janthinobacterium sp. FT14W TaxID=2654253 RepID=UPI001264574C|nr:hypothetical protein [Janthinobacterium sp. FT14W]KAB8059819.1 hypothetical protein GCN74_10560 [Janthinobacterium sp. FT14W]